MRKFSARCMAVLLALCCLLTLAVPVFATGSSAGYGLEFDDLGEKTASRRTDPGEYEITLSVPGSFEQTSYNELIVMVDASTSQSANFGALKQMLGALAEDTLSNDSSIRLTLMGFGVGPKTAGSFYTPEQLAKFLARASQEDLMQERSATNIEVALQYIDQYITNSPNLKKAVVLFTSDGDSNLDETPLDWSAWDDPNIFASLNLDAASYVSSAEMQMLYTGGMPLSATAELFPAECSQVIAAQQTYGAQSQELFDSLNVLSNAIAAQPKAYITNIIRHVYAFSGMTWGQKQTSCDMELAFQRYFRNYPGVNHECYSSFMDLFYIILGNTGRRKLPNSNLSATNATKTLLTNEKLDGLYFVGYSGADNRWMNPAKGAFEGTDISKLSFTNAGNKNNLAQALKELTTELIITAHKDVTVTDPMSKWVTMDPSTIRIYDDVTGTILYQYGQGWLTDVVLTEGEPVTVTTNADGHLELRWRVKDGYLLHTDRYSMRYVVNVDETAEGFVYGTDYPANDTTTVVYTNPDGGTHENEIPVPDVQETVPTPLIGEDELGILIHKQTSLDRMPIADITFDIYAVDLQPGDVRNLEPTAQEIAKYAVAENLTATLTTDIAGTAGCPLPEGIYLVVERENDQVEAPADPFYVILPMYDQTTDSYLQVVKVYPKNIPIEPDTPPPEPEYPDPDPEYKGWFSILKHDQSNEALVLPGAQFQVLRLASAEETGTAYSLGDTTVSLVPVTVEDGQGQKIPLILTTGSDGLVTSPELEIGVYYLAEVQAPAGYYANTDVQLVYATATTSLPTPVKIPNQAGTLLPSTGGPGTALYSIFGIGLLLTAILLLMLRRRSQQRR